MGVAEFFIGLFLILGTYIFIKMPRWKSDNRVSPPGYTTDYHKMNVDRNNGMNQRDIDNKNINGGYDVKADKNGCPDRSESGTNWMYGGKSE
ncbi:hypothetical protein [Konateibacter massiliensis]|uniref:hypothetical protein n=1 Tax=Konateibacter massiliensis TaxID=2002841 RepID=UPI000C149A80|nr:hypothetical protein [Konateibacter massiliensis]